MYLKVIGKLADLPEQHQIANIRNGYSIKFNLTSNELLNQTKECWLNFRRNEKG